MSAVRERSFTLHIGMGDLLFAVYLLLAALFLGVKALFGFSPLDIGMYMSGYEWFNHDPDMLPYLGQWQMTYHLTGWLCSLFGVDTFYGLRLMRIVLLLLLQTMIWMYLRRQVPARALLAGMVLVTLSQCGAYSEINYNDWSAFWLILSVLSYHKGLFRSRQPLLWIAVAGVLAGWNIMFRIVNLSFLLLPFAVWFATWKRDDMPSRWRQIAVFASGVTVGFAFVVLLSWCAGSLDVLKITWENIVSVGGDEGDTHGWKTIVREYFSVIVSVGLIALIIRLIILVSSNAIKLIICCTLGMLIFIQPGFNEKTTWVCSVCMSVLPMMLSRRYFLDRAGEMSVLYLLSLFVLLILPLGSNAGLPFLGPLLCVLSLPVAMAVLDDWKQSLRDDEVGSFLYRIAMWSFYLCLLIQTAVMLFTPQMEDGKIYECCYTINSPKTIHIKTTQNNADVHNRLLSMMKKQIPVGSTVITNAPLTMLSMLNARPYAMFSDIFSSVKMNKRYIDYVFHHGKAGRQLPFILEDKDAWREEFSEISVILSEYAQYNVVWTDNRFSLLKPTTINIRIKHKHTVVDKKL